MHLIVAFHQLMSFVTQYKKVHLVVPVYSEIMNKNSVQNIKEIKGNIDFVKVVHPKVSLQFSGIGY